jgi:D-alanyl-D-alanine carboxypeptidase
MDKLCVIPFYDSTKEERYMRYKQAFNYLSWEDAVTYVNIGLDQEYYTNVQLINNPVDLTVLVNKYRQLDKDYVPPDLERMDTRFNPEGLCLRHCARQAFNIMCESALSDGIHMEAVSAYRSFSYQQEVYYRNQTADISLEDYQAIRDKVSARAGHSEHQTGLAVDINELEESFEETIAGRWLAANSHRYGFILRYPKGKEDITGYSYEPWHFRYLGKELACDVYLSGLTYDEYYMRHQIAT